MMMAELLVGIDLGTSSVKIGAFSLDGQPRYLAAQPYHGNPLKPEAWWEATCKGLHNMIAAIGDNQIKAIGVGGQGPTLVGIDRSGRAFGLAIPWSNTQAEIYADQVSNQLGNHVNAGWSYLLRVYWIYQEDKNRFDKTFKFMQPWDFITYRLTGALVGSELPWSHPWSRTDLEKMNFPSEKFVDILDWGSVLGEVSKVGASQSGLPAGIQIVGCAGDATLSMIGSPGLELGCVHNEGGSSGGISALWDKPIQGEGLFNAPSVIPGWWITGGPTSSSGRTVQWILHDILKYTGDYCIYIERALSKRDHPGQLMFLPYMAGERTPIWDISARGVFLGLSIAHRREDLISAVVEGITLGLKDILVRISAEGVNLQSATVIGAQALNPTWNQIKADAFGIPIEVPLVKEATCLGAAAVAGWGTGIWTDVATAGKSMSRVEYTCDPNAHSASKWAERLITFRELYKRTRDLVA
jgi:xylulokinase